MGKVPKKIFKSPMRKLVNFFEKSRNQWKSKYIEAQKVIKYYKNKIVFLEKSKESWKARAKELKAQTQELNGKIAQMKKEAQKKEMDGLKKKI